MQKKNRVIIGVVAIVVAVTAIVAGINHYSHENATDQDQEVESAPESRLESEQVQDGPANERPADQPSVFFKIDTARRQMRINRRTEKKRINDSIQAAEKNSGN